EQLAVPAEADDRRQNRIAVAFENDRPAVADDGDFAVGRAQVDADDDVAHDVFPDARGRPPSRGRPAVARNGLCIVPRSSKTGRGENGIRVPPRLPEALLRIGGGLSPAEG